MISSESHVAQMLLQIKAIKLNPTNPFTWASGWKSPIYCDNRKTLSHVEVRNSIRDYFKDIIKEQYPNAEGVVGVATGAIAIGMLVADVLELPFIYIRASAKGHGMQNMIEGDFDPKKKYVVIEDLVSTGGSSLKAVEALRDAKCEPLGMLAIFTYGFETAVENFTKSKVNLQTLSNYEALIEEAAKSGYVKNEEVEVLKEWRTSPSTWKQ